MAKGTFARMADILKSNINEALDRAEDPEKMIKQMVREMEEAVNKATASVGTAVANQKRLERQYHDKQSQAEDLQRKAEEAVHAGEDDLARRALERKSTMVEAVRGLQAAVDESWQTAEQLRDQLRELKSKLEEARTRQGSLVARHRAAEARKKLAQSISGLGEDAFSSFERFEEKVDAAEVEAEAHQEIAGELRGIEQEIRSLKGSSKVEDELKSLKARLSAKTATQTDE